MSGSRPGENGGTHTPGSALSDEVLQLLIGALGILAVLILSPLTLLVLAAGLGGWWWRCFRGAWLLAAGTLAGLLLLTGAGFGDLVEVSWRASVAAATGGAVWPAVPGWFRFGLPCGFLVAGLVACGVELRTAGSENATWQQRRARRTREREIRLARVRAAALGDRPEVMGAVIGTSPGLHRPMWRVRWTALPGGVSRHPLAVRLPAAVRTLEQTGASRDRSVAVIGATGSGKSVFLNNRAVAHLAAGGRVIAIDCKAAGPGFAVELMAAREHYQPGGVTGVFPLAPINMWRGTAGEITARLMEVIDYAESGPATYYRDCAMRLLHLTVDVPGGPPRSSGEFLARLGSEWLKGTHGKDVVDGLSKDVLAAADRYRTWFHSARGLFDGEWSWGDVDLSVCLVRTLGNRRDAEAQVRVLLATLASYVSSKPHDGRPLLVIIDEFSAIRGARELVTDLIERGRESDVAVLYAAQSFESLGTEHETARMIAGGGGTIFALGMPDPSMLERYVGTKRRLRRTWKTGGPEDDGTSMMEEVCKIDLNEVRRARRGHGWQVAGGEYAELVASKPVVAREAAGRVGTALRRYQSDQDDDGDDGMQVFLRRMTEEADRLGPARPGLPELPPGRRLRELALGWTPVPVRELWALLARWYLALAARVRRGVRR